jgi:hypothetical protein
MRVVFPEERSWGEERSLGGVGLQRHRLLQKRLRPQLAATAATRPEQGQDCRQNEHPLSAERHVAEPARDAPDGGSFKDQPRGVAVAKGVPADASVEPSFAECSLESAPGDVTEAERRPGLGGEDVVGRFRAAADKRLLTLEHAQLDPLPLAALDLLAGSGSPMPTAVTVPEPHA